MDDDVLCPTCRTKWNGSSESVNCPICELKERIDENIEAVLLQILTSHYSKYIFEIDDKSAVWNQSIGFSFRINRKHNLKYLQIVANIHHKNSYLLLSAHIESAFNDIEHAYEILFGSLPSGVNSKKSLYDLFVNFSKQKNFNNSIFKSVKYKKVINYIRLISNVIKHRSGIVNSSSILGKSLNIATNISLEDIWNVKLKGVGNNLTFSNIYEITCIARSFLFDLSANLLSPSKVLQPRKTNIIGTTNLLKLQLRRNIGKEIIKNSHREGLMIFNSAFVRKANNEKLYNFVRQKLKVLRKLYKINPKYVISLEVGIGHIPDNNPDVAKDIYAINFLITDMYRRQTKEKPNARKLRLLWDKIKKNLSSKYSEESVNLLLWNEFSDIDADVLPKLIIDFYTEVLACGKGSVGMLMRKIGEVPFRRWNPFYFNTNIPQ